MKKLLGFVLMAVLAFSASGCGSDNNGTEQQTTPDSGTTSKPDSGSTCTPACGGKNCGDSDGCGGKCAGACPTGKECNAKTFACESSTRNCTVPVSFPTVAKITDGGETDDLSAPTYAGIFSAINADAVPDFLGLELYEGSGVFASGLKTGTFQLKGDELNYATCGACALIYSDVDFANQKIGATYMATGGTLTLSSFKGQLTGTLSNATFEHVTIAKNDPYTSTPVGDGCTTAITSVDFDSTLELMQ